MRMLNLKPRLKKVADLFMEEDYQIAIDTCCDHAYLGLFLSDRFPEKTIICIDVVEKIISKLKNKYTVQNLTFQCQDASTLSLSSQKTMVFICGVGGELAAKIILGIKQANDANIENVDFIVSANNKTYLVREALKSIEKKSFHEELVFENGLGYEIIFARSEGKNFDLIGRRMFHLQNEDHVNFLHKKKQHLSLKVKSCVKVKPVLEELESLF